MKRWTFLLIRLYCSSESSPSRYSVKKEFNPWLNPSGQESGGIDFFDGETDNYKEIINSVKKRFEIGKKVVTGDYYAKKQDGE